jgi:hypothetical protein
MLHKLISFFSWNVRGLGQSSRCDDVLAELISPLPIAELSYQLA